MSTLAFVRQSRGPAKGMLQGSFRLERQRAQDFASSKGFGAAWSAMIRLPWSI